MIDPSALEQFRLFSGLGQDQLNRLAALATEYHFSRGDAILQESQPAQTLYVICEGWVDVILSSGVWGNRQEVVATLTTGDALGWSAVVEPYFYTATALCITPVTAIGIAGRPLLQLFEEEPDLGCQVMLRLCRVIADRLLATRRQITSLFMTH